MEDLAKIRLEIDKVDMELAEVLCKRAELAKRVRDVKARDDIRPYLPKREKEILDRVVPKCVEAGFSQKSIEEIFLSIISASRSIVGDFEVCFPGIKASSRHSALVKQFGPIENYKCVQSLTDCINNIDKGISKYGVFPFSSTESGIKTETLEMLINREIKIISSLEVEHAFSLYCSPEQISEIKKIYLPVEDQNKLVSWATKYLPSAEVLLIRSDLELDLIVEESKNTSLGMGFILASNFSLELGLPERVPNISISPDSARYFIVERGFAELNLSSSLSLVCAARDKTGILSEIISSFSSRGISLNVIESRKLKSAVWDCLFYIEADTKGVDQDLQIIINELESICSYVKILGCHSS